MKIPPMLRMFARGPEVRPARVIVGGHTFIVEGMGLQGGCIVIMAMDRTDAEYTLVEDDYYTIFGTDGAGIAQGTYQQTLEKPSGVPVFITLQLKIIDVSSAP